jgi:peptidyl-prolyl cis-trans isomerase C
MTLLAPLQDASASNLSSRSADDAAGPPAASWRAWLGRAAASPLLHFLVLGGVIFALAPHRDDTRRIDFSSSALATLHQAQATHEGLAGLTLDRAREVDARAIEDEMLYREALRLGIDKDDPIVRQRLVQKLLLLIEDLGGASHAPTEAELEAYYGANRTRYVAAPRVRLVHVFARQRDALPPLTALGAVPGDQVPALGEPFPYARDTSGTREELGQTFGSAFAEQASALPEGEAWSEPIASRFGWHRVHVVSRSAPRQRSFSEVRTSLALDYALDKRSRVIGHYLGDLARQYGIYVDGAPLPSFSPTWRVAVRNDPSAED